MNLLSQKRVFSNLKSYGKYLLTRPLLPKKRFVIFGRGRSGSTLLVSLLNTHSQIQCHGEILHDWVPFPNLHINVCASRSQTLVYGFKLLSYQIRDVQPIINPERFLDNLYKQDYKLIYLTRDNLLDHALSNIYARRNKFHHTLNEKNLEQRKMYVDFEEIIHWIKHSQKLQSYEQAILRSLPYLKLTYEENLLNFEQQQKTASQIFTWLNLPSQAVNTNLVKLRPYSRTEQIENYQELVEKLQKTEYASFL